MGAFSDVKDMKITNTPTKERLLLVAVNNDKMKVFGLNIRPKKTVFLL